MWYILNNIKLFHEFWRKERPLVKKNVVYPCTFTIWKLESGGMSYMCMLARGVYTV